MGANTFLFTGEESFLIQKEIVKRKTSFAQKYGANNVSIYAPNNFDVAAIAADLFASSLFAQKKLVIIYGVPDDTFTGHKISVSLTGQLGEILEKQWNEIGSDTIVIFVAYTPDKRKKLFKFLSTAVTKHQTYDSLTPKALLAYVEQEAGGLLDASVASYLIERVGRNVARLTQEIDKLCVYVRVHDLQHIARQHIDLVVYSDVDVDSFALLDNLYRDQDKALALVDHMRDDGLNRNQVTGTLYWGLKVLLLMIDCIKKKIPSNAMAKELGVHPFVVAKHSKYHELLVEKEEGLWNMLERLVQLDYDIKTGNVSDSVFWLEVKQALLSFHRE